MRLKNKHFFVLEDDLVNRAVIIALLEGEGAKVVFDHWGDSSLSQLLEYPHKIDAFLLDIMLKGKRDGYYISERIRQHEAFQDAPIVFISASDPDTEIPKIKELGLNGFISKPINSLEFPLLMLDILEGRSVWR